MNKETVLQNGTFLVYLASCSLSGASPDGAVLEKMDGEALYRLSKFHSMQGICKLAIDRYLKNGGVLAEKNQPIYAKFKLAYEKAVKKLVAFSFEREALYAFFEELKMPYLPLKGIILSPFYPAIGMRQMTDNDIVIDPKQAKKIRAFMLQRGYTAVVYGKGCHDLYCKGNLAFELHRTLVPETLQDGEAAKFCRHAIEKAKQSANGNLQLSFSNEDFYLYLLLHTYKHFEYAGIGIRSLVDIYVYRRLSGIIMDEEYLKTRLSQMGILTFAENMESLADILFATPPQKLFETVSHFSSEQSELLLFLITSGTFGTEDQKVKIRLKKAAKGKNISLATKVKYLFSRIFPPYSVYRERHPRLSKCVLLVPFLWLERILCALFSPRSTIRELENLKEAEGNPSATTKE